MNAITIRNLTKSFGAKQALCGLDMTVPVGSIYGLIGENGCGKSTTEKIICGLMHADGGSVTLFDRPVTDPTVRAQMGVLIESPGCFANMTVWNNLMLQADNLGLSDAADHVRSALKLVRMEGAASNKYKNCSLGMKQRIGIAMALLGDPTLLILDEPINGLDADGMRIMREILTDLAAKGHTVVVSSHVLSELEKVATHYGIMRGGRMLCEMTAQELDADCRSYLALRCRDNARARNVLASRYSVTEAGQGLVRVYDVPCAEDAVTMLAQHGLIVTELYSAKISLEEYYVDLIHKEVR